MVTNITHRNVAVSFIRVFFVAAWLFAALGASFAQTSENPADCNELKDPDVMFQMDLCKAHVGCSLVMSVHKTCVKAKKFFTNLKEQVGEGVKGLFGYRKEFTSEHVFEANLEERQKMCCKMKNGKIKQAHSSTKCNTSKGLKKQVVWGSESQTLARSVI